MELSSAWQATTRRKAGRRRCPAGFSRSPASLEPEPCLISQLVRVASVSLSVAALEQTVKPVRRDRGILDRPCAAFAAFGRIRRPGRGIHRAMVGERVSATPCLKHRGRFSSILNAGAPDLPGDRRRPDHRAMQKAANSRGTSVLRENLPEIRASPPGAVSRPPENRRPDSPAGGGNRDPKAAIVGWLLTGLAGNVAREESAGQCPAGPHRGRARAVSRGAHEPVSRRRAEMAPAFGRDTRGSV